MPSITAAYLRVSTLDQTVAAQRTAIQVAGQTLNRDLTWYEDAASGAKRDRPGLARLMADVRAGAVRQVIVWKFDRFARSVQHLLDALEEFRARNVIFTSLTEGIDTATPVGRMVYTFLAAIAEFERALIRERVGAGIAAAQKRGVRFGRPRLTVGSGSVELLREQGFSITAIADRLGIARATVRDRLARAAQEKGEPDATQVQPKGTRARQRPAGARARDRRGAEGAARAAGVAGTESVHPGQPDAAPRIGGARPRAGEARREARHGAARL
jgi:DNA invertase Pin-like site-specific DNA recombinase